MQAPCRHPHNHICCTCKVRICVICKSHRCGQPLPRQPSPHSVQTTCAIGTRPRLPTNVVRSVSSVGEFYTLPNLIQVETPGFGTGMARCGVRLVWLSKALKGTEHEITGPLYIPWRPDAPSLEPEQWKLPPLSVQFGLVYGLPSVEAMPHDDHLFGRDILRVATGLSLDSGYSALQDVRGSRIEETEQADDADSAAMTTDLTPEELEIMRMPDQMEKLQQSQVAAQAAVNAAASQVAASEATLNSVEPIHPEQVLQHAQAELSYASREVELAKINLQLADLTAKTAEQSEHAQLDKLNADFAAELSGTSKVEGAVVKRMSKGDMSEKKRLIKVQMVEPKRVTGEAKRAMTDAATLYKKKMRQMTAKQKDVDRISRQIQKKLAKAEEAKIAVGEEVEDTEVEPILHIFMGITASTMAQARSSRDVFMSRLDEHKDQLHDELLQVGTVMMKRILDHWTQDPLVLFHPKNSKMLRVLTALCIWNGDDAIDTRVLRQHMDPGPSCLWYRTSTSDAVSIIPEARPMSGERALQLKNLRAIEDAYQNPEDSHISDKLRDAYASLKEAKPYIAAEESWEEIKSTADLVLCPTEQTPEPDDATRRFVTVCLADSLVLRSPPTSPRPNRRFLALQTFDDLLAVLNFLVPSGVASWASDVVRHRRLRSFPVRTIDMVAGFDATTAVRILAELPWSVFRGRAWRAEMLSVTMTTGFNVQGARPVTESTPEQTPSQHSRATTPTTKKVKGRGRGSRTLPQPPASIPAPAPPPVSIPAAAMDASQMSVSAIDSNEAAQRRGVIGSLLWALLQDMVLQLVKSYRRSMPAKESSEVNDDIVLLLESLPVPTFCVRVANSTSGESIQWAETRRPNARAKKSRVAPSPSPDSSSSLQKPKRGKKRAVVNPESESDMNPSFAAGEEPEGRAEPIAGKEAEGGGEGEEEGERGEAETEEKDIDHELIGEAKRDPIDSNDITQTVSQLIADAGIMDAQLREVAVSDAPMFLSWETPNAVYVFVGRVLGLASDRGIALSLQWDGAKPTSARYVGKAERGTHSRWASGSTSHIGMARRVCKEVFVAADSTVRVGQISPVDIYLAMVWIDSLITVVSASADVISPPYLVIDAAKLYRKNSCVFVAGALGPQMQESNRDKKQETKALETRFTTVFDTLLAYNGLNKNL